MKFKTFFIPGICFCALLTVLMLTLFKTPVRNDRKTAAISDKIENVVLIIACYYSG